MGMHNACDMVKCMGHIQIRNVPEEVHRTLKAQAARQGMSLSEYLLRDVVELASRPTLEEMVERVRSRPLVRTTVSAAELVREACEERDRELG
jgi:antitoxin FitA